MKRGSVAKSAKDNRKAEKKKPKYADPQTEYERAIRFAAIREKREKVIKEVQASLAKRRQEKIAIQNWRLDKEEKAKEKALRDAEKSDSEKLMLQIRKELSTIAETGIKCVYTSEIMPEKVKYEKGILNIKGSRYRLRNNLHIVGWGKEAVTMSAAFERIVGKQLRKGFMVVPRRSVFMMWSFPEAFPKLDSRITYTEAGTDGLPDDKAVFATRRIVEYCKKLKKRDLLIIMLSHDVDDLLCCPREEITLRDKLRLLQRLKRLHATPEEINIVRNKMSIIRGGDLARTAYPARVIILVTSDVGNEPLDAIAGGPCTYDPKGAKALAILTKYNLINRVSQSVRELIQESIPWEMAADEQLDEEKRYKFVQTFVIACNADAMECMSLMTYRYGLFPIKLNSICSGPVEVFAQEFAKMASLMVLAVEGKINKLDMYEMMRDSPICPLSDAKIKEIFPLKEQWGLGRCLLFGGRPTYDEKRRPQAGGISGPNQEVALYFSRYWHMRSEQYPILRMYTVWFLGASSYGKDGDADAVGAFGYKNLYTDIYPYYEKVKQKHREASLEWYKVSESVADEQALLEARSVVTEWEKKLKTYTDILPDRVLTSNNTNLLYQSVNHGDELFELQTGNYYTFTNVGDIYIIRIVRFQCNCDGTCHEKGEGLCADRECAVNRTMSAETSKDERYCCLIGAPRIKDAE